ncbi:hypothetical protein KIF24_31170 [Micromonospora sp. Llam7]|uniref:hypothetical protein n=1 Tax=Micromonospora tarapacensis TaxID=2835305 RepID=UPI001C83572C|nr:hypothetical protein [Micromonospora tarapacensis]MBX7270045.1 hypothetical protein [Micromonospora tarapacensis]
MDLQEAEGHVKALTRRVTIKDALAWLNEDRGIERPVDLPKLLQALLALEEQTPDPELRSLAGRVSRQVCRTEIRSDLDPSQELLGLDDVIRPAQYRAALDALAARTAQRSLADVTLSAVIAAQEDDPNVVTALCAAAGLAHRDLRARVRGSSLPGELRGKWKNHQLKAVFEVIDAVISGRVSASSPAAQPARPVEHLLPELDEPPASTVARPRGWALVEQMRTQGVPYEVLLAQRAVGGAWVAHRNSTGSILQAAITTTLCRLLDERGVTHHRLKLNAASRALLEKAGANPAADADGGKREGGQLAILIDTAEVTHAVAISVARDGGTARKSGGRLAALPTRLGIDCTVVLVGPGWAQRNETSELARPFQGRIYTERTLAELADALQKMIITGARVVAGADTGTVPSPDVATHEVSQEART